MPYDLYVPAGCDYLTVKWHGFVTSPEMRRAGIEAMQILTDLNLSKVLVDWSEVQNQVSIADLYSRTDEHSKLGPVRARAALLGTPEQADDLIFVENVGSNRGIPLKAFTNMEMALNWLTQ